MNIGELYLRVVLKGTLRGISGDGGRRVNVQRELCPNDMAQLNNKFC